MTCQPTESTGSHTRTGIPPAGATAQNADSKNVRISERRVHVHQPRRVRVTFFWRRCQRRSWFCSGDFIESSRSSTEYRLHRDRGKSRVSFQYHTWGTAITSSSRNWPARAGATVVPGFIAGSGLIRSPFSFSGGVRSLKGEPYGSIAQPAILILSLHWLDALRCDPRRRFPKFVGSWTERHRFRRADNKKCWRMALVSRLLRHQGRKLPRDPGYDGHRYFEKIEGTVP